MIVAERTLRNKIPERRIRAAFVPAAAIPAGRRFLVPSAGIAAGRSRSARCGILTLLLYASTINKPETSSVGVGLSRLWFHTEPKAAKQSHDYRIALPELMLDGPARQRFMHRMVGDASSLRKSQIRRHL
jgi:hypothetical protein